MVHAGSGQTAAHEALLRTPSLTPRAMLALAERFGRLDALADSVHCRLAERLATVPTLSKVFLNVHPSDLARGDAFGSDSPLVGFEHRIVLELLPRRGANAPEALERLGRLRMRGYHLAVDGDGSRGSLDVLDQLRPEVVKLGPPVTSALARRAHTPELGRRVDRCHRLAAQVIAVGIETSSARTAAIQLGCDLLQGYAIARPTGPACL